MKNRYGCIALFCAILSCAETYAGQNSAASSHAASAFEEVMAQVYLQHPKLAAQREELRILDERVAQANAGFRPTLSANAAYGRQRVEVESQDRRYGEDRNASLVLTQPLFSGLGTVAQSNAAKARVAAGRAQLLAAEQSVLFSAIGAWLELCEKEAIFSLTQDNLYHMYRYLEATQERYRGGDGTVTDVALAESRVADAESRFAMAEADRDVARAAYERDTGMEPKAEHFPAVRPPLPKNREEAAALAKNNPDLAQAQQAENAAGHDIDSASSSLWPSLSMRGAMNEERSTSFGLGKLRNDSLTLNVSIPLYQGGAEYSRIREAKLAREKSRQETLDIAWEVKERARMAWSKYAAADKIITASHKAAEAAKTALSGIEEEQAQGTRTLTEVLDARSALLGAQISEMQAQKSLRLEAFRLLASTGKLTAEGLSLPVALYNPEKHYEETARKWAGTSIAQTPLSVPRF